MGVMNNYNYDASLPACAGGLSRIQEYSTMCFDPLVDYTHGILDTPHLAHIVPPFEFSSESRQIAAVHQFME